MKKIKITKTHCPDTYAYCDHCHFNPTEGKQPTIAVLRSRVRNHVEKTGHTTIIVEAIRYSLLAGTS